MLKLSAVIAEYNPFHNGHQYNLTKAKSLAENTAVIMSGNFTQRGEIAILDKYQRAIHAIKGGADVVIELPSVYATANAEIFALGGVKIFDEINADTLVFGAEKEDKQSFKTTAKEMLSESVDFKNTLKTHLKSGYTLVKAKSLAYESNYNVDKDLLSSPNNILGLEYVKSILTLCPNRDFTPILRTDKGYLSTEICGEFSSANAIRNNLENEKISLSLPPHVYGDLPKQLPNLDKVLLHAILSMPTNALGKTPDCTEGLENRIKKYAIESFSVEELIKKVSTKRYTNTRIKRILINALLGIDNSLVKKARKSVPYVKILAIKKEKLHLLSTLSQAKLITCKKDYDNLNKLDKKIFDVDVFACQIYSLITGKKINPFEMKIV